MKASRSSPNLDLHLTISIEGVKRRCEHQTAAPSFNAQESFDNEERQLRFVRQRAEIATIVRDRQLRTMIVYSHLLTRAGALTLATTAFWLAVSSHDIGGLALGSFAALALAIERQPIKILSS